MFVGNRVEELISDRRITKKALCASIGLSVMGLDNMIKGADVRVSSIEKVADYLKVPIDYFFDREVQLEEAKIHIEVEGDNILRMKIRELESEVKELIYKNGKLEGKLELLTGKKAKN